MGRDLADARRIVAICREHRLSAAVNFQLRFAPNMLAIKDALERGVFGDVLDVEVRINLHTPWNYWAFLKGVPRLEVLMHSIHYIDLIRSLIGEPRGVYCKGVRHPGMPDYSDTRTRIVLDYGDTIRCSLTMNHSHTFGGRHEMSQLKLEGTRGAAIAKMGVNDNYPAGEPDTARDRERRSRRAGVRLRCAVRGSSRRSRVRCRICSDSTTAKIEPGVGRRRRNRHDGCRRGVLRISAHVATPIPSTRENRDIVGEGLHR